MDGDEIDDLVVGSLDGLHVYWGGAQLIDGATEDLLVTSADQITLVGGLHCADVTGDGLADIVAAGEHGRAVDADGDPGRPRYDPHRIGRRRLYPRAGARR
ncbi:MAG: VCBS repeat-containing protein, partial [Myxococcota bacterium]